MGPKKRHILIVVCVPVRFMYHFTSAKEPQPRAKRQIHKDRTADNFVFIWTRGAVTEFAGAVPNRNHTHFVVTRCYFQLWILAAQCCRSIKGL